MSKTNDAPRVPMTEAQARVYFAGGGSTCPFCGSRDIEGHGFDFEAATIWRDVSCNTCNYRWRDIHDLTRVQDCDSNGTPTRVIFTHRDSAAECLSDAVDAYLKARHLSTGPMDSKLIEAQVQLMNAQQAYEVTTKADI